MFDLRPASSIPSKHFLGSTVLAKTQDMLRHMQFANPYTLQWAFEHLVICNPNHGNCYFNSLWMTNLVGSFLANHLYTSEDRLLRGSDGAPRIEHVTDNGVGFHGFPPFLARVLHLRTRVWLNVSTGGFDDAAMLALKKELLKYRSLETLTVEFRVIGGIINEKALEKKMELYAFSRLVRARTEIWVWNGASWERRDSEAPTTTDDDNDWETVDSDSSGSVDAENDDDAESVDSDSSGSEYGRRTYVSDDYVSEDSESESGDESDYQDASEDFVEVAQGWMLMES